MNKLNFLETDEPFIGVEIHNCFYTRGAAGKGEALCKNRSKERPSIAACWDCHNKALQTGWLKQQKFPQSSGSRESKVKVLAELVSF